MKQEKICGIYVLINTVNLKEYVGQSVDIYERWKKHSKSDGNTKLCSAIKHYGWGKFDKHILEECSWEELNDREIRWIAYLNTTENGYNMTYGGEGGVPTEEAKAKISEALKGNTIWKGKHHTEATKQKMSESRKGKTSPNKGIPMSEEQKKKISESEKGKLISEDTKQKMSETHKGKQSPNKGNTFSEETKQKMSEAHKGKHRVWDDETHTHYHYE